LRKTQARAPSVAVFVGMGLRFLGIWVRDVGGLLFLGCRVLRGLMQDANYSCVCGYGIKVPRDLGVR